MRSEHGVVAARRGDIDALIRIRSKDLSSPYRFLLARSFAQNTDVTTTLWRGPNAVLPEPAKMPANDCSISAFSPPAVHDTLSAGGRGRHTYGAHVATKSEVVTRQSYGKCFHQGKFFYGSKAPARLSAMPTSGRAFPETHRYLLMHLLPSCFAP